MPTDATPRASRKPRRASAHHDSESSSHDPRLHRNEVVVVGRLAATAELRELPSGDAVVIWRLVVERAGPPVAGRPHLDTLECAAWIARVRRTAVTWQPGDTIEVRGALRRRFWRGANAVNNRYEIETAEARRVARAHT